MAWIELHQSLPTHRKTIECASALNIPLAQMVGHVCCLWLWALDNTDDGVLSRLRNVTVALASRWEGDADAFVCALLTSGFLEKEGETLIIHDWDVYAGRLLDQRKANRERQKRHREKNRESNGDVTVMNALRNGATVPNHTVPNSTNNKTLVTPVERRELREFAKGREEGFLEWWNEYPRKGDKKRTRKVWEKLFPLKEKPERLEQTLQNLWLHTEAYKREVVGKEKQFIKLPATFLNAIDVSEPPE